jgi:hypothetical protein
MIGLFAMKYQKKSAADGKNRQERGTSFQDTP